MTNVLLLLLALSVGPAAENFAGMEPDGRVTWWIASNLCVRATFEARVAAPGTWTLEMSAGGESPGGPAGWVRIGEAIAGESVTRQTVSVPAPWTGNWFFRLRRL